MASYNHSDIERKWQQYWDEKSVYKVENDTSRPKFYTLDMFPYPSGAGLHVGHPLGYIASDIYSRYKRHKGYNVLHPMGFDAFGLPAEQYAIETGQHPALTTEKNINRYIDQLKNIGFNYDWDRSIKTCDGDYYKWTQWIFLKFYHSYYDLEHDKARPIDALIEIFEASGNSTASAATNDEVHEFSAADWKNFSSNQQKEILLEYRLAFLAETTVNWCPALGTVLANDEVKDGLSERGGHPVERKVMRQWSLKITAYADRLLNGLDQIDWPEPVKEMQRNWIGKSIGAEVDFNTENDATIKIFTTRIDTIFGSTFMVLAPEHPLLDQFVTAEQHEEVQAYVQQAKNRSERERMSEVKKITGVFTGSYAFNPFNNEKIPIWIADYVLYGYGTGAIMAVPAHDSRDYAFAKHFDLPIRQVVAGGDIDQEAFETKDGTIINSGMLNGLSVQEAINKAIEYVVEHNLGKKQINYRLRDAIFSRQRYWGEPFPIYFDKDSTQPRPLNDHELPLTLPAVDTYLPTETGEPPLGRAENWRHDSGAQYELSTMPGWAGSSWYFFRYMDPNNALEFVSSSAQNYWENVDLYIGGTEHATGHLLYSRFWTKFLYDLGFVTVDEPFKKLVNQGMIQGRSSIVYRIKGQQKFVSYGLRKDYEVTPLHVAINLVQNDELDIEAFKKWRPDFAEAEFVLEDGKYICGHEVEKMSKRWYNVVNPDDIIERYGADTLRLYEMFLGPIEDSKPWNTNGIDGVYKFIHRFWRLFYGEGTELIVKDDPPTDEMLKTLHKTIKKVTDDIEKLSFNTAVSSFMICVNELTAQKCNNRQILEPLCVLLAPFAPHIAEELWHALGHKTTVVHEPYPSFDESYLQEDSFEYPVSVNGKLRTKMKFALDMSKDDIEQQVLAAEAIQKWTLGKPPKKVIIVPKRIVNIVV